MCADELFIFGILAAVITHRYSAGGKKLRDTLTAEERERQEARAVELEMLGYLQQAMRVRTCGLPAFFYGYPEIAQCKIRICPSCARRIAHRHAVRIVSVIHLFRNPTLFLVTMPTMHNLALALSIFREMLERLKRIACFRPAVSGISAIETRLADDGEGWQVHCHLIIDDRGLDLATVQREWKRYTAISGTNWAGRFLPHHDPKVDLGCLENLARYITKCETWCPCPQPLTEDSLRRLETLFNALRHRRLLVSWGMGVKKRVETAGK